MRHSLHLAGRHARGVCGSVAHQTGPIERSAGWTSLNLRVDSGFQLGASAGMGILTHPPPRFYTHHAAGRPTVPEKSGGPWDWGSKRLPAQKRPLKIGQVSEAEFYTCR